jgi:hypothetical protein
MPQTLTTQSPSIKGILHDPGLGRIILVSANGLDIYRVSDWTRIGWATLANVTCGAINDNGIYLGTADSGIWRLPLDVSSAATAKLTAVFGPSAAVAIQETEILDIDGARNALAVATSGGLYYLPSLSAIYKNELAAPILCAVNAATIIWASSDSVYKSDLPASDWSTGQNIANCITNSLQFESTGEDIMIGHAGGLLIGDPTLIEPSSFSTDFDADPVGAVEDWTKRWIDSGDSLAIESVSGDHQLKHIITTGATHGSSCDVVPPGEDFVIEAAFRFSTTAGRPRLIARGSGTGTTKNGIILSASRDISALQLTSYVNDTFTTHATAGFSWSTGTVYRLKLSVSGPAGDIVAKGKVWLQSDPEPDWQVEATIAGQIGSGWVGVGGTTVSTIYYETLSVEWPSEGGFQDLTAEIGTVGYCTAAHKVGDYVAYGTSDGEAGGQFGIIDITDPENPVSKTTTAGDVTGNVWIDDTLTAAIYDNQLERYRLVAELSPTANAASVRRDWTLYAEITDALGGIETGTVALTVNGTSQTPTVAAITNGFAVTYTPPGNSGYGERVTIVLSGTDSDGQTVSRSWVFTTAGVPALTATDASPPNVVCIRDISLSLAESDETVGSVNVVWLDTHTSPLIVTEAQAREVGRVKIDETTYHRHRVGVRVLATDAGTLQTRDLSPGSIATITCAALGMTAQKCEILAAQRTIDESDEDISFDLQAAYYEEV